MCFHTPYRSYIFPLDPHKIHVKGLKNTLFWTPFFEIEGLCIESYKRHLVTLAPIQQKKPHRKIPLLATCRAGSYGRTDGEQGSGLSYGRTVRFWTRFFCFNPMFFTVLSINLVFLRHVLVRCGRGRVVKSIRRGCAKMTELLIPNKLPLRYTLDFYAKLHMVRGYSFLKKN